MLSSLLKVETETKCLVSAVVMCSHLWLLVHDLLITDSFICFHCHTWTYGLPKLVGLHHQRICYGSVVHSPLAFNKEANHKDVWWGNEWENEASCSCQLETIIHERIEQQSENENQPTCCYTNDEHTKYGQTHSSITTIEPFVNHVWHKDDHTNHRG